MLEQKHKSGLTTYHEMYVFMYHKKMKNYWDFNGLA